MKFLRQVAAGAMLWTGAALADAPSIEVVSTPEDGLSYVQQRRAAAYADALASYDFAVQADPANVAVAVARCEFIAYFIDDDMGGWIDSALDDYEQCSEALAAEHPDAPAALLFELDQVWGDELVARGEALLKPAEDWPEPMRRRLLASLSRGYAMTNEQRAGELALAAVALGDASRVTTAVAYLVAQRRFDEAFSVLRNAPVANNEWEAIQRVDLALSLPDRHEALREWHRHANAGMDLGRMLAARVQLHAGNAAASRRLLQDMDDADIPKQFAFDLAMATGDHAAAARTIDLASLEAFDQNFLRFVMLAFAAPSHLLSTPSMMAGLFICLLLLAALALAPGLVLVPVHYRGLVRRLRGKPAAPLFERARLRHAWYALALFVGIPVVVALLLEPEATVAMLGTETLPNAAQLSRMMMWGTVVAFICLLPAFRGWGRRQLIGDRASLAAVWHVLLVWGVLVGISLLLATSNANPGGTETLQTRTIDTLLLGANDAYGPVLTLLLLALLIPVFEELVFRGLVLGGLSRHIGFGWANTLQAALFAAMHDDLPRLPFYFALGLLAGWLVKRTGSLGPAIALHSLNNLLAAAARLL